MTTGHIWIDSSGTIGFPNLICAEGEEGLHRILRLRIIPRNGNEVEVSVAVKILPFGCQRATE